MNIVIDVGNTRTKYAFFEDKTLIEVKFSGENLWNDLALLKKNGICINVLLAGSSSLQKSDISEIKRLADYFCEAHEIQEIPLSLAYSDTSQLGFDRIADCVGALSLYKDTSLLVIDSGTCITFNYVDENACFLGGNISPGMEIRFRALNDYTEKLPLVEPETSYGGIAANTKDAILNGVMSGILYEVEKYIELFYLDNKMGRVVLTGGNSKYLLEHLKMDFYFVRELGLLGLNELLILKSRPLKKGKQINL